jgi:hypothetical protein
MFYIGKRDVISHGICVHILSLTAIFGIGG